MATSVIPKSLASDLNVTNARYIKSRSQTNEQIFDLSELRKTVTEPFFLFTAGYSTMYIVALIAMNEVSQSDVSYSVLASKNRTIESVTYVPSTSTLTITLNGASYRNGVLLLLQG